MDKECSPNTCIKGCIDYINLPSGLNTDQLIPPYTVTPLSQHTIPHTPPLPRTLHKNLNQKLKEIQKQQKPKASSTHVKSPPIDDKDDKKEVDTLVRKHKRKPKLFSLRKRNDNSDSDYDDPWV